MSARWAGRRLLVVVAHPDDETFGCGSLILNAAANGASVTVCCATRGEAGDVVPGYDLSGSTIGERRVSELHAAAQALGVTDVVVLDFEDSGMSGNVGPRTLVGAPLESVVDAVLEVIDRVDPDVVVTLDAGGGDGHRDHVRIAVATTEALHRSTCGASLYYWCVTRSLLSRWLERLRQANPDSGHLELDAAQLGRSDNEITTIVDVSTYIDRRRSAMTHHASQRSPYEGMPDDLVDAFLRCDTLLRVEPPWTGGPLETELLLPAGQY